MVSMLLSFSRFFFFLSIGVLIAVWGWTSTAAPLYTPCQNGMANIYPCEQIDLLAHMPLAELGGGSGSDLWGWVDPVTAAEIVLYGRSTGVTFVDITDPVRPRIIATLPTLGTGNSLVRDIKVIADHAVIVSEAGGDGLQIIDLNQLRTLDSGTAVTLTATAHYTSFEKAHNVVANEETGFVYVVGVRGQCDSGLLAFDMTVPTQPVLTACFADDNYIHDAQCEIYRGTDADYVGRELCFLSSIQNFSIIDVTDKANIHFITSIAYPGATISHQGWLTEDHRHFLMGDEGDERNNGHNTRTYVWDLADLDALALPTWFETDAPSLDHNLYINGDYAYLANYNSGVYIYDIGRLSEGGNAVQVGRFDLYPEDDLLNYWHGAWTAYPFFPSGTLVASSLDDGLFILRPHLPHQTLYLPILTNIKTP